MNRVEQVSGVIEQDIRQCKLLPGDKLPGQLVLMRRFEVSRTCLREAITVLEAKGLVTSRHGSGCYVNNLFEGQFASAFLGSASGVELDSVALQLAVMEMRLVLESEAAKYVCERATDAQLACIDDEYQTMQKRKGSSLQRAKADLQFHMLIAHSSHNLIVVSLSQLLYTQFFNAIYGTLARTLSAPEQWVARVHEQHEAIYHAIMRRDAVAAQQAASKHIQYSMSLLEAQG
ncbi:MAG: FadR family transcriptional regulator [Oceanospirillaceae bacterium]|nr:FadR family transcriptional regulator [Oceanospirillaceae bacterium]